ncbi:hypothetical protein ACFQ0M_49065 [Kitasatospora aburaviensis]|uniref:Uncharacterized protein n=1 Tax=Kitasatospora aburaviensis TaxID=67265 RepID=A0ABW1F5U6_9ACTN
MAGKQSKQNASGGQRISLLPPDNGGWYISAKPDWVNLAPIRDSAVRAWHIMRDLVVESRGPVRSLTLDELCKMVPMITADGTVKPSSLGRMRDIFRDLSSIGLISDPKGGTISTSSSVKAASRPLSIRVNDWPTAGVEYEGWRNAYAKLEAIRAGLPFDKPIREESDDTPDRPRPPARKPRKKAEPKPPAKPKSADGPAPEPAAPAASTGASGGGLKPGWKSNQAGQAGWISNQPGWIFNPTGWISNHDSAADLQERDPSCIPFSSIPFSSAPSVPETPSEAPAQPEEEEKIDEQEEPLQGQAAPSAAAVPAQREEPKSAPGDELSPEVQQVVTAWLSSRDSVGVGPHRGADSLVEFTDSAVKLVAKGESVEWLVAVAAWMGAEKPSWWRLGEAIHAQYAGAPARPAAVRKPDLGKCPRHPVMPKDCPSCRREEMQAEDDSASSLDIAGVLAELGIKL